MTAHIPHPGDTFVAWLILTAALLWIASDRIVVALAWLDRRNAETDAEMAADFEEPAPQEWWLDYLNVFGISREEMAARYAAAKQEEAEVAEFCDEMETGGYWATWDALDDHAEDELDRAIRDGLAAGWGSDGAA